MNHRIIERVERDLKDHPFPTLLPTTKWVNPPKFSLIFMWLSIKIGKEISWLGFRYGKKKKKNSAIHYLKIEKCCSKRWLPGFISLVWQVGSLHQELGESPHFWKPEPGIFKGICWKERLSDSPGLSAERLLLGNGERVSSCLEQYLALDFPGWFCTATCPEAWS